MHQEMLQHIHAEQINEAKLQFFINISHEIRTPMSLIIIFIYAHGLVEELAGFGTAAEGLQHLCVAYQNLALAMIG